MMMKGMTLKQYTEVVEFLQKYHPFIGLLSPEEVLERNKKYPKMYVFEDYGMKIKYVDSIYDSRDRKIWSVSFRRGAQSVRFATNHFNALNEPPKGWKYDNIYDLCMAYLQGEFIPKEEFIIIN